jgi:DNA adenine methylase
MTTDTAVVQLALPGIGATPLLKPFIKWPGGKSHELPGIAAAAPVLIDRFIDPFVGGGAVLLATPSDVPAWANDACPDLVRLYVAATSTGPSCRDELESVAQAWDAFSSLEPLFQELAAAFGADAHSIGSILADHEPRLRNLVDTAGPGLAHEYLARIRRDIPVKFRRMAQVETSKGESLSSDDLLANIEGAVRAPLYMAIRNRYNRARTNGEWNSYRSADFFFLREFAYAAMFRFNANDAFNVPYGGISYNRNSFRRKVAALFSQAMRARIESTTWRSMDFGPFLDEVSPARGDLIFVDPPYDSDFSAYDNLAFGWRDQQRLKERLEDVPAHVMLVIKDTPTIRRLYGSDRWQTRESSKTYMWTIKSRNDRRATHLLITNY